MRLRFTFILILLNIGAAFYIFWLEKKTAPEDAFDQSITNWLPNSQTVDLITISTRGEDGALQNRKLERTRNRWEIVEPYRWPANDNAIARILTQLQFLEIETTIPLSEIEKAGQTLSDFGLQEPKVVLTYQTADDSTSIKIGAPTKLGSRLYILSPDGNDVLVVTRELLESIDISLENLRSPQIFNLPIFEIRSLRIQAEEQRIVVTKNDDKWAFETPVTVPADPEAVTNTLGMLTASKAIKLIPTEQADTARFGLTNPFMRITLVGNDRRETLVLGAKVPDLPEGTVPQRYAQLEIPSSGGTIFTVNSTNFDWLVNAADELRERRFLNINPSKVTALRIKQGTNTVTVQKLEKRDASEVDAWQVLSPDRDGNMQTYAGDTDLIDRLLERLYYLSAKNFVSDAPSPANLNSYGFDDPNASISIDSSTPLTLVLGSVDKDNNSLIYAKREAEPYVYAVESRILGLISSNPLTYRNRILDQQPPSAQVTAISLKDLQNDRMLLEVSIDPAKQTWPVALEAESDERKEATLALIDDLKTFEVQSYLYNNFREVEAAPWRYQLTSEILLPGAEGGRTLKRQYFFSYRMGADKQLGGSPELNSTFTLTQKEIDSLFELTILSESPDIPDSSEEVESADVTSYPMEPNPSGPEAPAQSPAPAPEDHSEPNDGSK